MLTMVGNDNSLLFNKKCLNVILILTGSNNKTHTLFNHFRRPHFNFRRPHFNFRPPF